MNNSKVVLLFLLPVLLSGCSIFESTADYYYLNPHRNLSTIGRVAIVELDNDSGYPEISADITESLFQVMQKKQVFSLTLVRQSDPAWRSLQPALETASDRTFEPSSAYTLEQLLATQKTLRCDATLIGTVTAFNPYPHMAIGLRLKLVDLRDGELLWALEQIWDATDKTTEDRIKNHYSRHILPASGSLQEKLGTVSSLKFIKFVAYEVAETLQPKR